MIGTPFLKAAVSVAFITHSSQNSKGDFECLCANGRLYLKRENLLVDLPAAGRYVIIPDHRLGLPMFVLTEERYKLFIDQNLPA